MRYPFLLAPLILTALTAQGADWTQFRGPRGSGVSGETGLPATWSAGDNIVWRTKLPGPGTSSPIVVGKRIYLTCYSGYGIVAPKKGEKPTETQDHLMRHLVCVERDKGAMLWTKDFKPTLPESKYEGGNNTQHGYSSSTLASDGKHLYAFFGRSGVFCLDLDGKEVWHANVGDGTHGWGSSNSPVLFGNLVIVNASIESRCLVALDKQSGKEIWRVKGIGSSWNTPVLVDVPSGPELVLSESKAVMGFDPATGKELWRVTGFGGYVCPSVVAHKDIVYVVRGEALAIRAGGRGDVTDSHVLWRVKKGYSSLVSSPVYHDGRLCWSGGSIVCLDAATGKEIYKGRLSEGASFYASPLVADGKIYCVSRFTGAFVIADGPKFKEIAHNRFADDDSRSNATPIVSDGCLLLRTDRYLYCIGKR
jgi:outer membrane protein assembly factor BamB